jgi:hypothetical protein
MDTPWGDEFTSNTATVSDRIGNTLAAIADGRFVVRWNAAA